MTTESRGDKVVAGINEATTLIGSVVPAVGALGIAVRLIMATVRPTDAEKAQAFDDAMANLDAAKANLDAAIDGFEAAKAARDHADQTLPGDLPHVSRGDRPDNTLPGVGTDGPDNALPGLPVKPDNALPPTASPKKKS